MITCLRCNGVVADGGTCECDSPVWSEDGLTPCGPPADLEAMKVKRRLRELSERKDVDDDVAFLLGQLGFGRIV